MAALLEGIPAHALSPADPGVQQLAQGEAKGYADRGNSHTSEVYKNVMPELVKGAGLAIKGGNQPLTDQADILTRAAQATVDMRTETWRGFRSKASVVKSMNPNFLGKYGALRTALEAPSIFEQVTNLFKMMPGGTEALEKSFTAGNLGIGSIYGLVPFDLLAPSRLIYPVYTLN